MLDYLHGRAVPEPRRLKDLAEAVGVQASDLTQVPAAEVDLFTLRRDAGFTLKTAATRARALLVRSDVRFSSWMLGELEAGRVPARWRDARVADRVATCLGVMYEVPAERIKQLWPASSGSAADLVPVSPQPVTPSYRLVGDSIWTWYARCPSCELVSTPGSGTYTWTAERTVDWTRPAELRCHLCGTTHFVMLKDLQPHDAEVRCQRPACGRTFPAPSTAVEAYCDYCALVNPGPAALANPVVRHEAATVRYQHTRVLQAQLEGAKRRAWERTGGQHPLLLTGEESTVPILSMPSAALGSLDNEDWRPGHDESGDGRR